MNEEKKIHDGLAQVWRMFNNARKDSSDAGWSACMEDARRISHEHPGPLFEKILLAVIEEAEAEFKIQDPQERAARYKAAAKAFNGAWELYVSHADITDVAAYCNDNPGKMAKKLSAAVYGTVCKDKNPKGAFMEAAYAFYTKYQDGAGKGSAAEAEDIIDRYPEHTMQMMELYHILKKRSEAINAAA